VGKLVVLAVDAVALAVGGFVDESSFVFDPCGLDDCFEHPNTPANISTLAPNAENANRLISILISRD
jgi:hypothetical protein